MDIDWSHHEVRSAEMGVAVLIKVRDNSLSGSVNLFIEA